MLNGKLDGFSDAFGHWVVGWIVLDSWLPLWVVLVSWLAPSNSWLVGWFF